jgi:Response regulator containing CheY-like receiver domain and AraC-type DNA-binding domain
MARKTFLLADDATFIRTILRDMIEQKEDYTVVGEAKDGVEAIEKAALLRPDIMTMDITMPEMDGIEALPFIASKSPNTKIIMVSAIANQEQILRALRRGAVDFIMKPFDKNRVYEVINKVLAENLEKTL